MTGDRIAGDRGQAPALEAQLPDPSERRAGVWQRASARGLTPPPRDDAGFTLIELLVVLAIVALLVTLALPRYTASLERAKESVLVENLRTTREAIGKFYADKRRFPDSLQELVEARYLRSLPIDPVLDSDSGWRLTPPEPPATGAVADLHSGASGTTLDGRTLEAL